MGMSFTSWSFSQLDLLRTNPPPNTGHRCMAIISFMYASQNGTAPRRLKCVFSQSTANFHPHRFRRAMRQCTFWNSSNAYSAFWTITLRTTSSAYASKMTSAKKSFMTSSMTSSMQAVMFSR